jgi:hypothetical protein
MRYTRGTRRNAPPEVLCFQEERLVGAVGIEPKPQVQAANLGHSDANARGEGLGVFDLRRGRVPGDWGFAEVGFVGHVAGEGGIVAEQGVLGNSLAAADGLEISPKVGALVVPGIALIAVGLGNGFFAGCRIVFRVPLLHVSLAEIVGEAAGGVITGCGILTGLGEIIDGEFGDFENSFGALETINFRGVAAEIEAQVHGNFSIFEECGVDIRHVASVVEAENAADGLRAGGRSVPAEHVIHAANEMYE